MTTPPGTLTAALDALWTAIRQEIHPLPPARITLSPETLSTDHGPHRWHVDTRDGTLTGMVVDSETLARGSEAALTHLLHEAAHVRCWQEGVQDVTTRGRYHNRRFLAASVDVGMRWPFVGALPRLGYPSPQPTAETLRLYDAEVKALAPAISTYLPYLAPKPASRRSTPQAARLPIACRCDPPRLGRMSRTVLELGPILCGVCNHEFTPEEG